MGTTAEKLQNIINVKTALSGIIADKGETVPEKFSDYPSMLSGGGSGGYVDILKGYGTTISNDIVSDLSNTCAYMLYHFYTTGNVSLPNVYESTGNTSVFRQSLFGVLDVSNLSSYSGSQVFYQLSCDELRLDGLRKGTYGTNSYYQTHIKKAWFGWSNISNKIPVYFDTYEGSNRLINGAFEEVYFGYLSSTTADGTGRPGGLGATNFTGNPNLSAIYCACSNAAAQSASGLSAFSWIDTPANLANRFTLYKYAIDEHKWYQLTYDGTDYHNSLVADQSSMPEIPTP